MKRTFLLSEEAERDLYDAAHYIAEDNPDAAERFLECFEETCDLLAEMPEAGSVLRTAIARLRGIRMLRVENYTKYLIFYRPMQGKGSEVIRVIHAASLGSRAFRHRRIIF